MNSNKIASGNEGLSRRNFLAQTISAIGVATLATSAQADSILSMSRLEELLSDGLNKPANMRRLRRLIRKEVAQAYRENPRSGFPAFNSARIDNDAVFFGNVRGNVSNQIGFVEKYGTHYDGRIKGKLALDSPDSLLARIGGTRFRGLERAGNIAFIIKDQHGTDIFVYYESGTLKYVFPTTTGSASTPDNMIVRGGYHRRKQREYNDAELANYYNLNDGKSKGPMPYSRRLSTIDDDGLIHYQGINTHIGNVSPTESSHGCARQGALGAALLFHTMKEDTVVYYRPHVKLHREG